MSLVPCRDYFTSCCHDVPLPSNEQHHVIEPFYALTPRILDNTREYQGHVVHLNLRFCDVVELYM